MIFEIVLHETFQRELRWNQAKEEGLITLGMSARKVELVLPPIFVDLCTYQIILKSSCLMMEQFFLIKMSQKRIWTRRFVGITTPQSSFVINLHNFTLFSRQISVGIFVQHALERVKVYFVILYNLSKCLKATPLIWLEYEISSPFSFVIWGTLFLLISTLAWRWKNFVFLSPARNHKLLDLSLHVLQC